MSWLKKRKGDKEIVLLSVDLIRPNPRQPREVFDRASLCALADSIRRYGVLQPVSVRQTEEGYELIAGERRWRASVLAGKREVPCIVYDVDGETSAELAVMENLLREDLNMFECAAAMEALTREYGLTQEAIAERLSVSQSYVANKLRLLRLNESVRAKILESGLTERHARALLRLPEEAWEGILSKIVKSQLNVTASERLVEEWLEKSKTKGSERRASVRGAVRDIRLFYNSVDRAVGVMRRCGVAVESKREETEEEIRLVISIPKPARRDGA